jgi:hypothetical protein
MSHITKPTSNPFSQMPNPTPDAVDVFHLCGATNMTKSGKVTEVLDTDLGRNVTQVNGDVPSAHFLKLPKIGKPPLALRGGFVYFQVRCRGFPKSRDDCFAGCPEYSLFTTYITSALFGPIMLSALFTLPNPPYHSTWCHSRLTLSFIHLSSSYPPPRFSLRRLTWCALVRHAEPFPTPGPPTWWARKSLR